MRRLICMFLVICLITTLSSCSYVAELYRGNSESTFSYQFPTPTPTYVDSEGELNFSVETETSNTVFSYFSTNNEKKITYVVMKPHVGPIIYKVIFQKWPYPADISVKTDNEKLFLEYNQNYEKNATEENFIVSFVIEKEVYIDDLVLRVDGEIYDNKNIKAIFGME